MQFLSVRPDFCRRRKPTLFSSYSIANVLFDEIERYWKKNISLGKCHRWCITVKANAFLKNKSMSLLKMGIVYGIVEYTDLF